MQQSYKKEALTSSDRHAEILKKKKLPGKLLFLLLSNLKKYLLSLEWIKHSNQLFHFLLSMKRAWKYDQELYV
jgi:hypothetical protein